MLFRLFFMDPELYFTVLGAIGENEKNYFTTSDVAMVMGEPRYRAWVKQNASCELSEILLPDRFTENCWMIESKDLFHNLIGRMVVGRKAEKAKKLFDILLLGRVCLCGQVADVLHFRPATNGKVLVPYLMELQKRKGRMVR